MDPRKLAFLQDVIGADGASALVKATSKSEELEWAVFPRVVMAWLEVVAHGDYDGAVPGVDGARLAFKKNEQAYSGCVDAQGSVYTFRDASIYHVAGSVAVALGGEHEKPPALSSPALAKLGKSIDLLVKARTLRKAQAGGGARGVKLPGTAAQPRPPQGPQAPITTQPKNTGLNAVGNKAAVPTKQATRTISAKAPGAAKPKIKLPGVKVTKTEAMNACSACGGKQFTGIRYTGCICWSSLAKSITTLVVPDGYLLQFGEGWDYESIAALAESFGK